MKKILVMASVMMLGASGAWALTQAGTQVKNTVQLTYTVGAAGNAQTPVDADDGDGFIVDRKIDVQVVENDTNKTVDVSPNQQDVDLTFIIANQGNDEEDYELTMANLAAPDDNFDPNGACLIDIGDGNGYVAFSPTITIAKETNATVKVQCDIPNTPTVQDDYNATIRLTATANNLHGRANQCENGDADTLGAVNTDAQNVCADGIGTGGDANYDGVHSDNGTYHVKSADLSATKNSCVIDSRAFNSAHPKRIPGATIRYYIQVTNNGSANADSVTTTDTLKAELTYVRSGIEPGACDCANWDGTSDAGTTNANVDLNFGTITAGTSECAYIDATIN